MNDEIQHRLVWIKLLESKGDAGLVCCKCGITRPTLCKWWRCFQELGKDGLVGQSKRPHSSPNIKTTDKVERLLLELRATRKLGARRLQSELFRLHYISIGLATIHKVLKKNQVKPL
ncbi:helix-turn-helix domain-containing protein [Paraglaciecola arctica]|nr:helix-turn-helix domain-containing protein [Paraglaciecola arctica]